MFRIFISYHPDDSATLATLLEWLDPYRHKYFVQIYYNRYDSNDEENQREYPVMLNSAQIYLYLVSQKWLADRRIQATEVDAVIDRLHDVGKTWMHLLPIQVKPCQWRNFSKLVEFEDLALPLPKKEILKFDARDDAYQLICNQLNLMIPPLRERMMYEAKLKGLPLHTFNTLVPTPKEKAPRKGALRFTLDDLKSWILVLLMLYFIASLYYIGCNDQPFKGK
jgi:hypothetical protein